MGIDKNEVLASGNDRGRDFDFDHLLRVDDVPNIDGDFDLTEDDMADPEMSAALQSLGWTEDQETDGSNQDSVAESFALDSDRKTTPKSKMEIQRELLGLKKKALGLRREGKTDEADRVLMNGKALEEKLKELENGQKVKPVAVKRVDFSGPVEVEDEETEDVTDADLNDSSYLSVLQNLGWKEEDEGKVVAEPVRPKSKTEIQRELLGLKRKSLALRREGNVDEAEEVLEKAKSLEARLAEMGGGETVVSGGSVAEKAETSGVSGPELGSVQQRVLAHKRKAVGLKREGKLAEAKEELKLAKLLENGIPEPEFDPVIKTNGSDETDRTPGPSSSKKNGSDETDRTPGPSLTKTNGSDETEVSPPPKLSSRERFKLQQESLSHKRKALKLRREGRTEEADAEFELAKNLESQLEAANESTKPAGPAGGDVSMEDLFDPQLLSALREVGIESSVVNKIPAKAVAAKAVVNEAPAVVNKIPAEAVTAPAVVNKIPAEAVAAKAVVNEERMEMEERIKAEKVKAVKLKRAGKQAEALDALRRAKLLEKKLVS